MYFVAHFLAFGGLRLLLRKTGAKSRF